MKTKYLVWMVLFLVIVNVAAIVVFFIGKTHGPPSPGRAADFLVKELAFTENQRQSYMKLVKDHRTKADSQRKKIKEAKKSFFDLLKQPSPGDSLKQRALQDISKQSEELDLITFNHFEKVRALCSGDQQKKFDTVISKVLEMMAGPMPPRQGQTPPPPPH